MQRQDVWSLGSIQAAVQQADLFPDFKDFVDMPLRCNMADVMEAFEQLSAGRTSGIPPAQLQQFLAQYFDAAGSDLVPCAPHVTGPQNKPSFTATVPDPTARQWIRQLLQLWFRELCWKASEGVYMHPERHTLLPLPHAMLIPGSRFREVYYWDSLWVVKGLLACGMLSMARACVDNLLHLLDVYGIVPNGSRTYYLNRSQPPLLNQMVLELHQVQRDRAYLERAFPLLVSEHAHWTKAPKQVLLRTAATNSSDAAAYLAGPVYALSRYYAAWDRPRPESYREDRASAAGLPAADAARLYREIATAAESGWDFSSRWLAAEPPCRDRTAPPSPRDPFMSGRGTACAPAHATATAAAQSAATGAGGGGCGQCAASAEAGPGGNAPLASLRTTCVVPADLNAFLYQMESTLADFAEELGDRASAKNFVELSQQRQRAMQDLMWCSRDGCWQDLILVGTQEEGTYAAVQSDRTYVSNWIPLWTGVAARDSEQAKQAYQSFSASGLIQPAGIATSLYQSGQQWDFPNAWPPLQAMMIDAMEKAGEAGRRLAAQLAHTWLETCHAGYHANGGKMLEKYDARQAGTAGGGGEYPVQTGFGWTNGVVLCLLASYGWRPSTAGS